MGFPRAIGRHHVCIRADVFEMKFIGPLHSAEVDVMRELMQAVRDEHGRCFLLADARELGGIDADARRGMAAWSRLDPSHRVSAVAVHGVSFTMRAVITLTINAIQFMSRRVVSLEFVAGEAQARQWIDARRAAMESQSIV